MRPSQVWLCGFNETWCIGNPQESRGVTGRWHPAQCPSCPDLSRELMQLTGAEHHGSKGWQANIRTTASCPSQTAMNWFPRRARLATSLVRGGSLPRRRMKVTCGLIEFLGLSYGSSEDMESPPTESPPSRTPPPNVPRGEIAGGRRGSTTMPAAMDTPPEISRTVVQPGAGAPANRGVEDRKIFSCRAVAVQ